jgi:hypothetical protein
VAKKYLDSLISVHKGEGRSGLTAAIEIHMIIADLRVQPGIYRVRLEKLTEKEAKEVVGE